MKIAILDECLTTGSMTAAVRTKVGGCRCSSV